jgi:Domain of unknown function (DUF4440)
MKYSVSVRIAIFGTTIFCGLLCFNPAQAQDSRWASADDLAAKSLINREREWAEAGCKRNDIEKTILADDFQGTSPSGSLYSKQEALTESQKEKRSEEACTLYEVKVHFFGDSMAILYGSESAIHTEADGRRHTVKLTWTDTWLKRHGAWQIVAAQDMPTEMK